VRVLIIGATGFIGKELVKELAAAGHFPVAVSRNMSKARAIFGPKTEIAEWDGYSAESLSSHITGIDAVVNLAGESIASGRWTEKRKKKIRESRIGTGKILVDALKLSQKKPRVIIQGSAIGIYGSPVETAADESQAQGKGFMAELTGDWESAIKPAQGNAGRMIFIRTGLVLGQNGGILDKMLLPFRFYAGTILGSGKQWMSWIHITDQVRAIRFLLENPHCDGAYNLTAPHPVRMKEFIHTIGSILRRPVWMKIPGFVLIALLGEMARETVLASQNILPERLLSEGFSFDYNKLRPALEIILFKKKA
jgi:uncharacterized protein